ncbi:hypothetical protein [Gordonia malaquae]|uniref:hypothetical protein n=1 Tax=Gordonia malaquae TaxID=410332 RepID=UPI00301730CC
MTDDWAALATAIRARREELAMSQQDVQDNGGPSTAKLREIENQRTTTISTATRSALEHALRWRHGSVKLILATGGKPVPDAPETGLTDNATWNDYLQTVQRELLAIHHQLPPGNPIRKELLAVVTAAEAQIAPETTPPRTSPEVLAQHVDRVWAVADLMASCRRVYQALAADLHEREIAEAGQADSPA